MNGTKLEGKIGRIDNTDLKATCWDIVVKNHIDLILFRNDFVNTSLTYKDYLGVQGIYGTEQLTEEEFNNLKEGLE